jgi:hypothetical protein
MKAIKSRNAELAKIAESYFLCVLGGLGVRSFRSLA